VPILRGDNRGPEPKARAMDALLNNAHWIGTSFVNQSPKRVIEALPAAVLDFRVTCFDVLIGYICKGLGGCQLTGGGRIGGTGRIYAITCTIDTYTGREITNLLLKQLSLHRFMLFLSREYLRSRSANTDVS
jgi:hypothetical protein